MSSLNDLLNKNKPKQTTNSSEVSKDGQNPPLKIKPKIVLGKTAPINNSENSIRTKPKPGKIKLRTPAVIAKKPDEQTENQIHTEKPFSSPFDELRNTLQDIPTNSISSVENIPNESSKEVTDLSSFCDADIEEASKESINAGPSERGSNFHNPTLEDVSKFVFDEQPDDSTEEIAEKFSIMLDKLNTAVGDEIPSSLARCLQFMKEHAFLSGVLKPSHIGDLVTVMRKSYGFIVQHKTEKSAKSSKRAKKADAVMDSISDLDFSL